MRLIQQEKIDIAIGNTVQTAAAIQAARESVKTLFSGHEATAVLETLAECETAQYNIAQRLRLVAMAIDSKLQCNA